MIKSSGLANTFKCRECGWRGILKRYTVNKYSFITFALYAILIMIVAYVINQVLQKNFSTMNIFPSLFNNLK
jgi:hypothetical protein